MNVKNVYYGWWIVASGFFISLYTAGVINFGFTAVFEPIFNEFGWSYTQISLASSLRGLETGLLAPLIGLLVDKWGTKKPLVLGTIITGFGLLLLSIVNSLLMFYAAYFLIAIGVSTCGGTLFLAAVVSWFRKRATLASGILSSGVAVGGLMVPLVAFAIDKLDWRSAMALFGIAMWVICLPLAFIFKQRPEESNLPANHNQEMITANKTLISRESSEIGMLPSQAVKNRAFWHICLALVLQFMVISAATTHVMPYLSTLGFTRISSSFVASAIPISSILGRIGFGWLGERHNKLQLASLGYGFTCLGLLFFALIKVVGGWSIIPFLICIGLGWGSSVPMRVSLVRAYFGRSRFGTIHGLVMGTMMIGNIAGPPLAGLVYDNSGSYQNIWYIFAGIAILSSVIILTAPSIRKVSLSQKLTIKGY